MWELHHPAPELAAAWREAGLWRHDPLPLGQLVDDSLRKFSDRPFTFRSEYRPWKGTYGDVRALALRAAEGLARRGISSGDIVAFQLPNWVEAAITFYAVTYLGAVIVPIVHTYGPKEVAYILRRSDVALFVTADHFGSTDYLAHLDEVRADLPGLESVIVVGDGPLPHRTESFAALLEAPALAEPSWGDPTAPVVIAYTSGTTSDPKGVIHSDVTLMAEMGHQTTMRGAGGRVDRPSLVGAPLGHAGGMYSSLLTPLPAGLPIHLIDKWDPGAVLQAMLEDGLSSGGGVTFFLTSLLDHPDCTPAHHALIGRAGMGGAAVPPAVSDRAEKLGIDIFRSYGSTEHPSITGSWGTRLRPSASTPTAAPCRAWTSAWSTTTVATSSRARPARSSAAVPTCSSATPTPRSPARPSTPKAGSPRVTSGRRTRTATSPSSTARRTSSSEAART